MIKDNIAGILDEIRTICQKIDKDLNEITLVGVTKYADSSQINEAIQSGLTHIGENKVQQAKEKFSSLEKNGGMKVTRHMIGHLQTNKVKPALEIFDCIQSVDSLKLATAIEEEASKLSKDIDILIQVNTAGEEQKFGVRPDEVRELIDHIIDYQRIHIRGLMTIAPRVNEGNIIRKCFRDLRELRDQIGNQFSNTDKVDLKYLSMGMSDDYQIALEEGSNMLRIGRAIFNQ